MLKLHNKFSTSVSLDLYGNHIDLKPDQITEILLNPDLERLIVDDPTISPYLYSDTFKEAVTPLDFIQENSMVVDTINIPAGASIDEFATRAHKQFSDFFIPDETQVNHYRYCKLFVQYGDLLIYDLVNTTLTTGFVTWIWNKLNVSGLHLDHNVTVVIYLSYKYPKFNNLVAYNDLVTQLRGGLKNRRIRTYEADAVVSDNACKNIIRCFEDPTFDPILSLTALHQLFWFSSKPKSVYKTLSKENYDLINTFPTGYARKCFDSTTGAIVTTNADINFRVHKIFTLLTQTPGEFDIDYSDPNVYQGYESSRFFPKNSCLIYILKSEESRYWSFLVRANGHDMFRTSYISNIESFDLYAYFEGQNRKPWIRLLGAATYLNQEPYNVGWEFTKGDIIKRKYKNLRSTFEFRLFYGDKFGNISELFETPIRLLSSPYQFHPRLELKKY